MCCARNDFQGSGIDEAGHTDFVISFESTDILQSVMHAATWSFAGGCLGDQEALSAIADRIAVAYRSKLRCHCD
jgi:hypothetical protein